MGNLVNLRRFRRARERTGRAEEAERNRAAFGRTRAERDGAAAEAERAAARLDAHRREDSPGHDGPSGRDGQPA